MAIWRMCFPLCYRPVLFISLSFCLLSFILLFHFYSFFVYKWSISVLKQGIFLGNKGRGQKIAGGEATFLPPYPRDHGPKIFLARTAPGLKSAFFKVSLPFPCSFKTLLNIRLSSTRLLIK